MHVAELWRYPVKSMRGESLTEAEITADGIVGDRCVHVENERGVITARTHPGLLGLRATLGPHGAALVNGQPWHAAAVDALVKLAAGPTSFLSVSRDERRFDVLPLLVATDGAILAFGRDGRRLRPNIVIGGVDALAERGWEGLALQIGPVVVRLDSLRQRCVMTSYDPDTLAKDSGVLRDIHRRFGGTLALNASADSPGVVRIGDPVHLLGAGHTAARSGT